MNLSELFLPSVDCVVYFFRLYFVVYTSCIWRFTESSLGSLSFQEGLVGFTYFPGSLSSPRVHWVYRGFTRFTELTRVHWVTKGSPGSLSSPGFTEFTKGSPGSLSSPGVHWVYQGVHQVHRPLGPGWIRTGGSFGSKAQTSSTSQLFQGLLTKPKSNPW